MAIVNSLRLSRSPSMVRFTMWVRNRVSRAEETKPGLFTTRASCSRTVPAGTGSRAGSAGDCWGDEAAIDAQSSTRYHTLACPGLRHVTRELTAAYVNSGAYWASLDSSAPMSMQSEQPVNTIMFVSGRKPEATIEQDLQRRGLKVEWANSIKAAKDLLVSASDRTAIVADLALADGNWTDLVMQVRCISNFIPIVLVSSTSTAELWWDALDWDVEDILLAPLSASRLCEIVGHSTGLR